jgi:hypothetical protein
MAGDGTIDDYLSELHRRVVAWHRRPDDVVAEAADHLSERVEELTADGHDAQQAIALAIAGFGSPSEVADAHLRTAHRPAIATTGTRTSGVLGMVGGVAWIGLVLLAAVLPDDNTLAWLGLAQVFHLAIAMSIVAMVGLWQRHGGLGSLSLLSCIPAALAAPFVLFVWPIPAWSMLLGLASLLFGIPVIARRVAPLASSIALTAGLAVSGAAVLGAEIFVTSNGEDFAFLESTPIIAAMAAGFVVYGLGLIGVGRWMRSEEPVEVPALPAPTLSRPSAS